MRQTTEHLIRSQPYSDKAFCGDKIDSFAKRVLRGFQILPLPVGWIPWFACGAILAVLGSPQPAYGQEAKGHWLESCDAAPGAIGRRRLLQGKPGDLVSQPVVFYVPEGAIVQLPEDAPQSNNIVMSIEEGKKRVRSSVRLGIQMGEAYRVCVRALPGLEDVELYPTIELLDRLSPPVGKELDFPIPLELTQEELRSAADGNYIIKVVYVEDPDSPIHGGATKEDPLPFFEVLPREDPLHIANVLGRPVAMIRVGAAHPDETVDASSFFYGYPAVERYDDELHKMGQMLGQRIPSAPVARLASAFLSPDGCDERCPMQDPAEAFGRPLEAPCYRARPQAAADEYVCDGGDAEILARVDSQGNLSGLSESDTVATFRTPSGQQRVVASSRVCLYSPRFAATRKTVHLEIHEQAQLAGGVQRNEGVENAALTDKRDSVTTYVMAERNGSTRVPHAVQDRNPGRLVDRVLRPEESNNGEVPWQNVRKTRTGMVRDIDRAAVQVGQHNAIEWSTAMELQIILDEETAQIAQRTRAANDGVLYESGEGAQLKLIKTASRPDAAIGETVSFSLRFENAGPEPIQQLTIVDNLPVRLEYVAGSQECTRPAGFKAQENSGTILLKWAFAQPLAPGDDGVITFDCKVR